MVHQHDFYHSPILHHNTFRLTCSLLSWGDVLWQTSMKSCNNENEDATSEALTVSIWDTHCWISKFQYKLLQLNSTFISCNFMQPKWPVNYINILDLLSVHQSTYWWTNIHLSPIKQNTPILIGQQQSHGIQIYSQIMQRTMSCEFGYL